MIDMHTHVYPDKIAPKIAEQMKSAAGDLIPISGDFTVGDLKAYMKRCTIEAVATFCVAERAQVVSRANDFLREITDHKTIFGFGTILPDMEDPIAEVRRIHQIGLQGIKFHSLFQPIGAGDQNLVSIYEEMENLGMIAYFHVGKDPGHPSHAPRTTPRDMGVLREKFPKLTIVAAHWGGLFMLEESRQWIIGKDIYIDTCWTPNMQSLDPELAVQFIRTHGAEKVLLATDYPSTDDPAPQFQWFKNLPLRKEEKELISRENARRLLGI